MTVRLLMGDCRSVLPTLPDESVHCVVTSPPYWGLRDYGTATWEGGDAGCDHKPELKPRKFTNGRGEGVGDDYAGSNLTSWTTRDATPRNPCPKCGARRIDSQIGLEPSPDAYVAQMVAVFREVRRVLRKDGTLWLNLGDSYANDGKWGGETGGKQAYLDDNNRKRVGREKRFTGLKPKDLVGIPWRVAFALQADGWYLRQDIIWSKPNPMPESVRDRCTKAHEYIFLLSKSQRYFYDAEAIAEESSYCGREIDYTGEQKANSAHVDLQRTLPRGRKIVVGATRNKRSVWEVATAPFSEAHFATFPPALIEPCIKAGCPKDGTVLDPFAGAGTTGLVADRLQRNAVLIELNPQYAAMADKRITGDAPLFMKMGQGEMSK